jgi:hypothetical protein
MCGVTTQLKKLKKLKKLMWQAPEHLKIELFFSLFFQFGLSKI